MDTNTNTNTNTNTAPPSAPSDFGETIELPNKADPDFAAAMRQLHSRIEDGEVVAKGDTLCHNAGPRDSRPYLRAAVAACDLALSRTAAVMVNMRRNDPKWAKLNEVSDDLIKTKLRAERLLWT